MLLTIIDIQQIDMLLTTIIIDPTDRHVIIIHTQQIDMLLSTIIIDTQQIDMLSIIIIDTYNRSTCYHYRHTQQIDMLLSTILIDMDVMADRVGAIS